MALLDWKNEYSVDVQSIDTQHKKLFGMVNELHDAMKTGAGSKIAPAILKRLVSYTREHFANEESMMLRAKYPDFASHKAEHDKLTHEVVKMVEDFESGKVVLSVKLLEFLRKWLQLHILSCDKKYTGHLQAAGLR
jgi:hemerythrin-like metal-binding protein